MSSLLITIKIARLPAPPKSGRWKRCLIKKGVLGSDSVDACSVISKPVAGPFNGARIVARAWLTPEYKARFAGRYSEGHR